MQEDEEFRKQVIGRLYKIERRQKAASYLAASLFAAGAGFTVFNFAANNRDSLLALIPGIIVGFICMGIAFYLIGRYQTAAE
jgi:hypothetical protein